MLRTCVYDASARVRTDIVAEPVLHRCSNTHPVPSKDYAHIPVDRVRGETRTLVTLESILKTLPPNSAADVRKQLLKDIFSSRVHHFIFRISIKITINEYYAVSDRGREH
jgi:hypothetical protein